MLNNITTSASVTADDSSHRWGFDTARCYCACAGGANSCDRMKMIILFVPIRLQHTSTINNNRSSEQYN